MRKCWDSAEARPLAPWEMQRGYQFYILESTHHPTTPILLTLFCTSIFFLSAKSCLFDIPLRHLSLDSSCPVTCMGCWLCQNIPFKAQPHCPSLFALLGLLVL